MKDEDISANRAEKPGEAARSEPAPDFFYEVSKRPQNQHKRLFAPKGTGLRTPSGTKVPPAWTDVWMTTDPVSPIQATGRDSKGRRVYLYSTEQMGRAAAAKFSRLKSFNKAYPSLLRKVVRDKKISEEALVLYLISKTGFRIGSNSETLAAVKAFGASTLRCSHVSVEGDKLSFSFTGKKGICVSKVLTDSFLADSIGRRCHASAEQPIFKTSDDQIRGYLNGIQTGSKFTVKDFRTYLGTRAAFRKIKTLPVPRTGREFKRYRKEVGEAVARELGNSPTIALNSYVAPEVFCRWESSLAASLVKPGDKRSSLTGEFLECVHYDQEVPPQEFQDPDPLEKLG